MRMPGQSRARREKTPQKRRADDEDEEYHEGDELLPEEPDEPALVDEELSLDGDFSAGLGASPAVDEARLSVR